MWFSVLSHGTFQIFSVRCNSDWMHDVFSVAPITDLAESWDRNKECNQPITTYPTLYPDFFNKIHRSPASQRSSTRMPPSPYRRRCRNCTLRLDRKYGSRMRLSSFKTNQKSEGEERREREIKTQQLIWSLYGMYSNILLNTHTHTRTNRRWIILSSSTFAPPSLPPPPPPLSLSHLFSPLLHILILLSDSQWKNSASRTASVQTSSRRDWRYSTPPSLPCRSVSLYVCVSVGQSVSQSNWDLYCEIDSPPLRLVFEVRFHNINFYAPSCGFTYQHRI